jgi:hypothetical protein
MLSVAFFLHMSTAALAAEEVAKLTPFGGAVGVSGDYIVVGLYVFKHLGTTWVHEATLTAQDPIPQEDVGRSVAIDGDVIVAGAPGCVWGGITCGPGAAYVFRRHGSTWTEEAKLTAPVPTCWDAFGYSVSISGDVIAAGGMDIVHVFRWNGTTWAAEAVLTGSDTELGDEFGLSVSVDGDFLVAGARRDDAQAGSAYVFRWDGGAWVQEAKLIPRDTPTPFGFGQPVAISRDWAVIGAEGQGVYAFHREGTSWVQRCALTPTEGIPAQYGYAVAISGDVIVVGAPAYNTHHGTAYLFRRDDMTWVEVDTLVPSDADGIGHRFGRSLCVDGGTGVVTGDGVYLYAFLGLPADLRDYAGFANCFGHHWGDLWDGCQSFDLEPDEWITRQDYWRLLERFTGP